MAVDIDLNAYNGVAQALLQSFDDAEIQQREGSGNQTFSYVPPERYRYRLLQVFKDGFTYHVENITIEKTGVHGLAHFIGEHAETGVRYDIKVPVFEPWTIGAKFLWNNETKTKDRPNPDAGKILNADQTFMKLGSAGIKACGREMGLGLHLYDKPLGTSAPRAASTQSSKPAAAAAPAGQVGNGSGIPNFDPEWDGSEICTIGTKHKGDPWSTCEDGYLEFITSDPSKANKKALKEIARRQSVAGQTGNANAAAAMAAPPSSDGGDSEDGDFHF